LHEREKTKKQLHDVCVCRRRPPLYLFNRHIHRCQERQERQTIPPHKPE
jgi:hypothetical protein